MEVLSRGFLTYPYSYPLETNWKFLVVNLEEGLNGQNV